MRKWECTVCGYIHEGEEPPDECPVCSADKSMFVEITAQTPPIDPVPSVSAAPPSTSTTFLAKAFTFASAQILRHHLHPIAVHAPNGILPMALVFSLIAAFLGLAQFETAAFYSLIFVLLNMPVVIFTGYVVWQKRYRGVMTPTFKIKIAASAVTFVFLSILSIWRSVQPDILTTPSSARWVYLVFTGVVVAAVGAAGHVGGKLVFGTRT